MEGQTSTSHPSVEDNCGGIRKLSNNCSVLKGRRLQLDFVLVLHCIGEKKGTISSHELAPHEEVSAIYFQSSAAFTPKIIPQQELRVAALL